MNEDERTRRELSEMPAEPLLPVEKRLIGWSLVLGVVLLIILVFVSRAFLPTG